MENILRSVLLPNFCFMDEWGANFRILFMWGKHDKHRSEIAYELWAIDKIQWLRTGFY